MSRMTKPPPLKYYSTNWLITIFAAITFATNFTIPMSGMPVLFKEISGDLNLDVCRSV